jgi:hypothetical protein
MIRIVTLFMCAFSMLGAREKLYFDYDDMPKDEDAFHVHVGGNMWIRTNSIHRDSAGFYTYTKGIELMSGSQEYRRKWKCPYCFQYWDIGQACQNPDCPSKYRT